MCMPIIKVQIQLTEYNGFVILVYKASCLCVCVSVYVSHLNV